MKEPEDILAVLEALNRQAAGPTAPAKGLTLIGMAYDGVEFSAEYLEKMG